MNTGNAHQLGELFYCAVDENEYSCVEK